MTIGVGDRVIVLRNDRMLGVINGTLGTITAIEGGHLTLRTEEPDPRDVRLPRRPAPRTWTQVMALDVLDAPAPMSQVATFANRASPRSAGR